MGSVAPNPGLNVVVVVLLEVERSLARMKSGLVRWPRYMSKAGKPAGILFGAGCAALGVGRTPASTNFGMGCMPPASTTLGAGWALASRASGAGMALGARGAPVSTGLGAGWALESVALRGG